VVKADIPTEELKHVLGQLVVRRVGKEIDLAMKKLRLRDDKAVERRRALSQSEVQAIIGDIEYQATYPEAGDSQEYIRSALAEAMQTELRRSHDVGVLCLSERFNSPVNRPRRLTGLRRPILIMGACSNVQILIEKSR
jgi:hypothetical protein